MNIIKILFDFLYNSIRFFSSIIVSVMKFINIFDNKMVCILLSIISIGILSSLFFLKDIPASLRVTFDIFEILFFLSISIYLLRIIYAFLMTRNFDPSHSKKFTSFSEEDLNYSFNSTV